MTIALVLLDLILAAIAYMVFSAVFIPAMAKKAAFDRLKAKERLELDRRLTVEQYFGVKAVSEDPGEILIPVKGKK